MTLSLLYTRSSLSIGLFLPFAFSFWTWLSWHGLPTQNQRASSPLYKIRFPCLCVFSYVRGVFLGLGLRLHWFNRLLQLGFTSVGVEYRSVNLLINAMMRHIPGLSKCPPYKTRSEVPASYCLHYRWLMCTTPLRSWGLYRTPTYSRSFEVQVRSLEVLVSLQPFIGSQHLAWCICSGLLAQKSVPSTLWMV